MTERRRGLAAIAIAALVAAVAISHYQMQYSSPPVGLLDGSLFFLDPPGYGSSGTPQGPSFLYRVTPG